MKRIFYRTAVVLLAAAIFLGIVSFAGDLLMPVEREYGISWDSYLQEPENSIDVLFCGSSMVYCDVIPAVIYAQSGIPSYVVAGPELTMSLAYYYLREACRTQSPRLIALELNGLFFNTHTGYTKSNVGYMPLSRNRIGATVFASERQEQFGLVFPLYNYHSRLFDLTPDDIRAYLHPKADPLAGYCLLEEAVPQQEITFRGYEMGEAYAENLSWLQRIAQFCQDSDISLLLYLAPAKAQTPEELLPRLRDDLAQIPHCALLDFNHEAAMTGIADQEDWYDTLHFNLRGAEKFSAELADRLIALGCRPSENANSDLWDSRIDAIRAG